MRKNGQILNTIDHIMIRCFFVLFIFMSSAYGSSREVVFGITGVALKEDLITMIQWSKYLQKKSGVEVKLKFARSYSEIKSMIEMGSVDIAYICGATYVNMHTNNMVKILALPIFKTKPLYHSLIITRKNSSIKSLNDLKGKIFAFSDPNSNSGHIAPVYEMRKQNIFPKRDFKQFFFTYDHGESILSVLEGFSDGAAVDELVYASFLIHHPKKSKELRIVAKLGPYPIPPIVYRIGVRRSLFAPVATALFDMNQSKEGQEILKALAVDNFVPPTGHDDYSQIKKMMDSLQEHSYE